MLITPSHCIAHLTRQSFSDRFLFCGVSSDFCKLMLSLEDVDLLYVILVFNIFFVMIIILNINTNFLSYS